MPSSSLRPARAGRRDRDRDASRRRALALGSTAAVAATGFGMIAAASARRSTARIDHAIRERAALPDRHPVHRAAVTVEDLGKWWGYMPLALGVAVLLLATPGPRGRRRRPRQAPRRAGAAAVVAAGALSTALAHAFDDWLPQPPAPPGHRSRRNPVFPSGHAFGPTAVAVSSVYLLARERLAPPAVLLPAALAFPVVTVAGKLAGQRHWASDVLGGCLAGTAVAAACLSAYELAAAP